MIGAFCLFIYCRCRYTEQEKSGDNDITPIQECTKKKDGSYDSDSDDDYQQPGEKNMAGTALSGDSIIPP